MAWHGNLPVRSSDSGRTVLIALAMSSISIAPGLKGKARWAILTVGNIIYNSKSGWGTP
jgi:hypothetical protein